MDSEPPAARVAASALGAVAWRAEREAASGLPAAHRAALGLFLRHLARGERVAQRAATRQAALAPTPRSARFLRSQARQERTHALVFDGFARVLGAPPLRLTLRDGCPYRAYEARLDDAAAHGDFLDTVVGTQIVLEALGEVLLARLDRGIARRGDALQRLRRRFLAQEASHHAFGAQLVADAVTNRPLDTRITGEALRRYRHLAARLIDAGAPALRYFGVAADDLHTELDARLRPWTTAC